MPRSGYAVFADDPAAVAVAVLRADHEDRDLLEIDGFLTADDRELLRELAELTVHASDARDASRLAASASTSVTATSVEIGEVGTELAALAEDVLDDGPTSVVDRLTVLDTVDPLRVLAAVRGRSEGELFLAADGDLRAAATGTGVALAAARDANVPIELTGSLAGKDWQVDVVVTGMEVPGGGQLLGARRFLAAYGTPETGSLGILGEQGSGGFVETADRILRIAAEGYDDGTVPVVPTFEIITHVASAGPEPTGDYSRRVDFEQVGRWVDWAADNDVLVVLDVQPGRTDFLTAAKELEEFLVQPHVGLALDPEWRLKPNQVHLRQIGTVDGTEVNTVVDWLADLVREHALPQKMLVLHQFKRSMITSREVIRAPEELFLVLHFDGQGGQPAKESGYFAYAVGDERWSPGWKNFYDEDRPMAGPQRVLGFDPQPVFISFQ